MYENLMRGGVVNASGEAPLLVAREKAPKKSGHLMLTFQIVGVPLEKMKDMSSVIAACIGMYVVDIQDGAAPHTYIIDVVADNALPAMIEWTAERMPTEETKFVLARLSMVLYILMCKTTPVYLLQEQQAAENQLKQK